MSENSAGRVVQGIVVSDKMQKTAVVRLDRRVKHPLYKKVITRSTKIHVHDPENTCSMGDVVTAKESPKTSKTKSWVLLSVVEKAS
ncbi:MAG: 30S ribosomal protein S17 [Francisellaceae bacterium]|jgi:small subunit ribosomal protein S17|nr:30S ribosomal protein S17 [Francisellaceae bacterium]MBT6539120.1 30S ribosomal protein S17 [Francisellaceae bacterium]